MAAMKVALVTFMFDDPLGGGAALAARQLAEALVRQDHHVVVITTHAHRTMRVEHRKGLTVYRFLPLNLYWVGNKDRQPVVNKALWQIVDIFNPHAFKIVQSILRREEPDLMHVVKLRGISTSVWMAGRRSGVFPIVQTCQDYELISPEGTLTSRVGMWAFEGRWMLRPYQRLRARFSQAVAAVTAPSYFTLEVTTASGFFRHAVKRRIPNSHGISERELRDQTAAIEHKLSIPHSTRFLYLGRLEAAKGIGLLCSAFVTKAGSHANARLDIAGWGSLENELRRKYESHPRITFHGAVYGDAKRRILKQADVLVLPSIWPEVFGIVIAEAFAHGRPVIGSNIGGIPELVRDGETGLLVTPGDQEELADTLLRASTEVAQLHRMKAACLETARGLTVDAMSAEYLSLYRELRMLDV